LGQANIEYERLFDSSDLSERESLRIMQQKVWGFFCEDIEKHGFSVREGQQNMALDIADAIANKQHLIVEAGVGIGKSFAYIVPLLLFHKQFKRPIVISTSTITLQEQLVEDIIQITKILNYPIRIVVAKGQTHYVCRKKTDELSDDKLRCCLIKSIDNGAVERAHLSNDLPDSIWNSICITNYGAKPCKNCSYYNECYFTILRKEMKKTNQAIVCNHDLLTAHLKKMRDLYTGLLPNECPVIVIDEAHNLEEKVRSSLTREYTKGEIIDCASFASNAANKQGTDIEHTLGSLNSHLNKCYDILNKQVDDQINRNEAQIETGRFFFVPSKEIMDEIQRVSNVLIDLNEKIQMHIKSNISDQQNMVVDSFSEIAEYFSNLKNIDENIGWIERIESNATSLKMCICPRNLSEEINELFFSARHICILTSATLTNKHTGSCEEMYRYLVSNIGFPNESDFCKIKGILAEPKASPFSYDKHTLLYCANDLPHPTKYRDEFIKAGSLRIAELLHLSDGRALILFTAKSDMNYVYDLLLSMNLPYTLLQSNTGASQESVLAQFRSDRTSVLLGTGAYWEGINIIGESLTNVIVFKLPFPVPDPIIKDKCDKATDPLLEILVPEMIIKLNQGIGRLIRSEDDKGIVSIIDSRLSEGNNAPYRKMVWDSLPIKNKTSDLCVLQKFYNRVFVQ
jgi:ATP-dependent DNA helicase DinG